MTDLPIPTFYMDPKQQATEPNAPEYDALFSGLEDAKAAFNLQWQMSDGDVCLMKDGIREIMEYQQSLHENQFAVYSTC